MPCVTRWGRPKAGVPCMASLTPQPGVGASSQPGEGGGLQIFLEVCLEWDRYCIAVFSRGCPYPDPLIRESRLLLELTAMPVSISGPPTSPALSLGYVRQKESPRTYLHAIPGPEVSATSSLPFRALDDCFMCNVPDFWCT